MLHYINQVLLFTRSTNCKTTTWRGDICSILKFLCSTLKNLLKKNQKVSTCGTKTYPVPISTMLLAIGLVTDNLGFETWQVHDIFPKISRSALGSNQSHVQWVPENVSEGKPPVGEAELSSHLVLIFVTGIYHHMPSRNAQLNILPYHIPFRHRGFSSILMMGAEVNSETSVQFHKSTRCHILEDKNFQYQNRFMAEDVNWFNRLRIGPKSTLSRTL